MEILNFAFNNFETPTPSFEPLPEQVQVESWYDCKLSTSFDTPALKELEKVFNGEEPDVKDLNPWLVDTRTEFKSTLFESLGVQNTEELNDFYNNLPSELYQTMFVTEVPEDEPLDLYQIMFITEKTEVPKVPEVPKFGRRIGIVGLYGGMAGGHIVDNPTDLAMTTIFIPSSDDSEPSSDLCETVVLLRDDDSEPSSDDSELPSEDSEKTVVLLRDDTVNPDLLRPMIVHKDGSNEFLGVNN